MSDDEDVTLEITTSKQVDTLLKEMLCTGLYGDTRAAVAEELVRAGVREYVRTMRKVATEIEDDYDD